MNREQVKEIIEKYNTGRFAEESEQLTHYLSLNPEMYDYLDGKPVKEGLNEKDKMLELAVLIANDKEIGTNPVMWELYWKSDNVREYVNDKNFLQMFRSKLVGYNISVIDALKYAYTKTVPSTVILFGWYSVIAKIKPSSQKPLKKRLTNLKGGMLIAAFTVVFLAVFLTICLNIGYKNARLFILAAAVISTVVAVAVGKK